MYVYLILYYIYDIFYTSYIYLCKSYITLPKSPNFQPSFPNKAACGEPKQGNMVLTLTGIVEAIIRVTSTMGKVK